MSDASVLMLHSLTDQQWLQFHRSKACPYQRRRACVGGSCVGGSRAVQLCTLGAKLQVRARTHGQGRDPPLATEMVLRHVQGDKGLAAATRRRALPPVATQLAWQCCFKTRDPGASQVLSVLRAADCGLRVGTHLHVGSGCSGQRVWWVL